MVSDESPPPLTAIKHRVVKPRLSVRLRTAPKTHETPAKAVVPPRKSVALTSPLVPSIPAVPSARASAKVQMKPSKGVSNLEPAAKLPPKKPSTPMKPNGNAGKNSMANVPRNSSSSSSNVPKNSSTTTTTTTYSSSSLRSSLNVSRGASSVSTAKFIETLQRRREFIQKLREMREKSGGIE